ncbi:MAG: ATP-binding protein, partial [Halovenus sp.]
MSKDTEVPDTDREMEADETVEASDESQDDPDGNIQESADRPDSRIDAGADVPVPETPGDESQPASEREEDGNPLEDALGSDVDDDMEIDEEIEEDDLLGGLQIDSSADIEVPDRLVDQVIGQDHARDIVLKAAKQRRHVMMIGSPGTGKSMLAKAMSQLLPKEELQDVLVYHNPDDGNEPKVRTVPAGKGEQIVEAHKEEARKRNQMRTFIMWIIIALVLGYALIIVQRILMGILAAGIIYLAFR